MLHFDLQLFGGSGASLGKRNRKKKWAKTDHHNKKWCE